MTEVIARILVPVDFSAHSDRALRYATSLASRLGATVELLHVVEDPFVSGAWSSEIHVPNLPELLENQIAAARGRLAELKAVAGARVGTTVLSGQPAHTIIAHATAGGFDLIVMGTHGRTGLSHVFMGSVAERVVRRAPCPVLTLREAAPTTEKESSREAEAVV
jgi:universal stress protein A